jgi:hypothetical protein
MLLWLCREQWHHVFKSEILIPACHCPVCLMLRTPPATAKHKQAEISGRDAWAGRSKSLAQTWLSRNADLNLSCEILQRPHYGPATSRQGRPKQIQSSNVEIRNNPSMCYNLETRCSTTKFLSFRFWSFGIVSNFVFRVSHLCIL